MAALSLHNKNDLTSFLCLNEKGLISIFGAGGKTSLMFALAKQLAENGKSVLTTTTTKIFYPNEDQARITLIESDFKTLMEHLADQSSTIPHISAGTRYDKDKNKVTGFSPNQIDMIFAADIFDWIIVEADGARRKPLKASNDTEPVLPKETTRMILVTGLDAVDIPLQESHVHRAAIFSERTGLSTGDPVTARAMAVNLSFEINKAKKLCPGSKIYLFLNKADRPLDLENAEKITTELTGLQPGLTVIFGSLQPESMVKNRITIF